MPYQSSTCSIHRAIDRFDGSLILAHFRSHRLTQSGQVHHGHDSDDTSGRHVFMVQVYVYQLNEREIRKVHYMDNGI